MRNNGVDINKSEYILLSDRGSAILKFMGDTLIINL
jgi:hypothetical protein